MSGKSRPIRAYECETFHQVPLVSLYTSRSKLRKDLRSNGVDAPNLKDKECTYAQTFARYVDGSLVHFVLLELPSETSKQKVCGTLAHEAFHVARSYFDLVVGEDVPAEEEYAYVVGGVAQKLAELYLQKKNNVFSA